MRPRSLGLLGRMLAVALAGAAGAGAAAAAASAQGAPTMQAPITIDGPSGAIQSLSGLSVARDGSGGLVYLESVGGVSHIFLSTLGPTGWSQPQQLDGGLPGTTTQPVIAAGNSGQLLIAFVNAGELYVVSRASGSSALSSPQGLIGSAINPAIALSEHGKGYLAFAVPDGGGWDVRDLYYSNGNWELNPAILNVNPANDAGTGTGAPSVAAAGDGEGYVAWGEGGHVYARRVWFAGSSPNADQLDPASVDGAAEVSADSPFVGTTDSSAFAGVTFREQVQGGSGSVSRVMTSQLIAGAAPVTTDVTGSPTDYPGIAMMAYGNGFATAELQGANQVVTTLLGVHASAGSVVQVDSLPNASRPFPVSASSGDYTGLIAWQHDPGGGTPAEIRARYWDGSAFGPELVASSPTLGPTNAAQGLLAAADHSGDAVIAYVQGSGAGTQIVVSELVSPPAPFSVARKQYYRRSVSPMLSWSVPHEPWGQTTYSVKIDGAAAGTTSSPAFRPPHALTQGVHTIAVTATNSDGMSVSAPRARFFVDTLPPVGVFTLPTRGRAGKLVRMRLRYADIRTGVGPADASGVASVVVSWGDGSRSPVVGVTAAHAFRRSGLYDVTVKLTDRAGNWTLLKDPIRVGG